MVASAAMAGVPLLNGFLSKEMFFAETVFIDAIPSIEWGLPIVATRREHGQRGLLAALRPAKYSSVQRRSRDAAAAGRSRRGGCACPSRSWCSSVSWWVSRRRPRSAPAGGGVLQVVGGALPAYSLAMWHGFNAAPAHERARHGRRHRSSTSSVQAARGRDVTATATPASARGAGVHRATLAQLTRFGRRALAASLGAAAAATVPRCWCW